ncbi:GNAT family N-acetyltransferase [Fictibacillus sp. KIGAM418]|uniref:GNAT family N-acetyltransferase n=1 Tax=Fictibacillus marinisediminis TaxID=2878389 RepID=A0A9X2BEE2_9BACL|nr:GNAT family N-acetyltransferase [Fictibacillus marinisediminis]MCK6258894.1 GNAT family N-acetyltransferase [Fictibacillus marinisediminis]
MGLEFKRASDMEMEEIYELAGENRREATGSQSEDNRQKMIEAYEHSAKFDAYFVCLMDNSTLLGWVMIDKSIDYLTGDEIGWINDLFVKVPYRGKGYSTLLMEEALNEFRKNGYHDVRLNVYTHNEKAMKLYEKIGFKDVSKFMKITL